MATTSTAAPQSIDTRYRRIISIAVPVMLANLAMPLQSLIDTAVVGNMSAAANLGHGPCNPAFIAIISQF